jgi:hypothetical protein
LAQSMLLLSYAAWLERAITRLRSPGILTQCGVPVHLFFGQRLRSVTPDVPAENDGLLWLAPTIARVCESRGAPVRRRSRLTESERRRPRADDRLNARRGRCGTTARCPARWHRDVGCYRRGRHWQLIGSCSSRCGLPCSGGPCGEVVGPVSACVGDPADGSVDVEAERSARIAAGRSTASAARAPLRADRAPKPCRRSRLVRLGPPMGCSRTLPGNCQRGAFGPCGDRQ